SGTTGTLRPNPSIARSALAPSRADTAASANPSIPRSRCRATTVPIAPNPAMATRAVIEAPWTADVSPALRAELRARRPPSDTSIRFLLPQHPLGDVRQDELGHHRGDAGDLAFAEEALDVEFLGIAHPAMGQHRGFAGLGADLAGIIFGGVGVGADHLRLVVRVIGGGGAQYQQLGRLQLDPAFGERVLDTLVL